MPDPRSRSARLAGAAVLILLLAGGPLAAQQVGPARGTLVVVGGGLTDPAIWARFVELAGGPQSSIVVIPTAGGGEDYDAYYPGLDALRAAGAETLTVLHTYDRAEADTEAFVAPLREATGVWFPGGRQWRLADAYLGTRTQRELEALLARGGVIGGSSAGATIQGSYLVRGDTGSNEIMMGDHEEGFGFLRNVAVDQHLLRRNRQFDLIEVIRAKPELLGIGIDENTAIVVSGDSFEVLGQGYVAIYDAQRQLDSGGLFYFLAPGDRFDLATREAVRPAIERRPLPRVEKEPWPKGTGGR
ncbi:MAG: cyanophycinase [Gemmatimonadota bacterium]